MRIAWPDGRSLLEQPAVTVAMFSLISQVMRVINNPEAGK